uniref:Uncharacterized protein n=1 Tax=Photinus pyralis TaxID=7054 RepID=A0A1Y1L2W0_PHOPY
MKQELTNMLTKGGFQLHKWSSNNAEVLNATPNGTNNQSVTQLENDESRRSLGVLWIPQQDVFTFKIEDTNYKLTKRNILSAVAKIFDPLGWLSPITISAKLFIQKLWLSNLAWDQEVPEEMGMEWKKFQEGNSTVGEIQLPRWIHYCDGSLELHGFCDASEKAYGAVIYTKSSNGKISLLTAKSKVAPAKSKPTLPKLELCAAVLLAKLVRRSKEALQIKNIAVYAWTDSTITLAWITGDPSRWTKFVANRVVEINSILSKEQWRHTEQESTRSYSKFRASNKDNVIRHFYIQ